EGDVGLGSRSRPVFVGQFVLNALPLVAQPGPKGAGGRREDGRGLLQTAQLGAERFGGRADGAFPVAGGSAARLGKRPGGHVSLLWARLDGHGSTSLLWAGGGSAP